jgi:hypothetical protein
MHSYQSSIGDLSLATAMSLTSASPTSATASDVVQGVRNGSNAIIADAIFF